MKKSLNLEALLFSNSDTNLRWMTTELSRATAAASEGSPGDGDRLYALVRVYSGGETSPEIAGKFWDTPTTKVKKIAVYWLLNILYGTNTLWPIFVGKRNPILQ